MIKNINIKNSPFKNKDFINFWEIGASGSLKSFDQYDSFFSYTGFEPNPQLAQKKRKYLIAKRKFSQVAIHNFALGPKEKNVLYECEHPGCSSLLKPNQTILKNFQGSRYNSKNKRPYFKQFDVVNKTKVNCISPNQLNQLGIKTLIDAIQIDIQGLEYNVLKDFPNLEDVLFIDVELSIQELYNEQKTFETIFKLLSEKHFQMLDIYNLGHASRTDLIEGRYIDKGELVQFNGIFVKKLEKIQLKKNPLDLYKLGILLECYGYYSSANVLYDKCLRNNDNYKEFTSYCIKSLQNKIYSENKLVKKTEPIKKFLNYLLRLFNSKHQYFLDKRNE